MSRHILSYSLMPFLIILWLCPLHSQVYVDMNNNVGIGIETPLRPLEVKGQILSSNRVDYPHSKQSNFLMRHFDNTTTHFGFFNAQSDANNNQVLFGGGAGSQFAATAVIFMTGVNRTTLLGTEGMRLNNQQRVRISENGGNLGAQLTVYSPSPSTFDAAVKNDGPDWAAPSDIRLKEDIVPFTDGLSQILRINPVKFKYKKEWDPSQGEQIGVIAQDMKAIAPYTVKEVELQYEDDEIEENKIEDMETYLSYNHSAINFVVINAIKEQQEIINNLKKTIERLEKRINTIEKANRDMNSTTSDF